MCALSLLWGTSFAQTEVTFDFDNGDAALFGLPGESCNADEAAGIEESTAGNITEAVTATKDGISITVYPGEGDASHANRIWNNTPKLRLYSGSLKVSGSGITKIEFAYKKDKFDFTPSTGELSATSNKSSVWTGEADEILFVCGSSTQIDKMVITIGGGSDPGTGSPEDEMNHGTAVAPISVADAIAYATAIGTDPSAKDFYVKGKICSIKYFYSAQYGTATYNISEDGSKGTEFTVYGSYYYDKKSWQEGQTQIKEGDEVIVCGKIVNYNGNTPEFANKENYLVSLNGQTSSGTTPVNPDTPEEINVAKALEIISGLADTEKTEKEYIVTGYVVGDPDFQRKADGTLYGNVNLEIADEAGGTSTLTVFRAKSYENESFTEETINLFKAGDKVVFQGKLQKYVKDDVVTPELVSGYLIKVGEGTDIPDTPEEINVAKALEIISGMADTEKTEKEYIVTGFVVGDPDFQRKADGTLYGNVNLEIADEAGSTSTLTVFRAKSYNNESFTEETINQFKVGDKVVFQGKLQKYVKDGVVTPELVSGYLIKVSEGSEVSAIAEWMECTSDGTLKNDATDNEVMHLKFYSNNTADWWTVTQGKVDSHYSSIQYSYMLDGSSGTFTQTIIKSSDPSEVGQTITIPITYKDGVLLLGEVYYKRISGNGPFDDESSALEEIDVAKALEIVSGLADKEKTEKEYIVSGYVVGTPDYQRKDGVLYGNVNLEIADEAGGTPTLTIFRGKSYDNADFTEETLNLFSEGDLVIFQGRLQKYGETPELVSGYLIKVEKATGIQNVKISKANGAIYNLAGQQVEKATKGIYIQNGKKFIVK